jgi:hypothetical protein
VPGIPCSFVMTEAASGKRENLHKAEDVTVFRTKKGGTFWFGVGVSILTFSSLTAIGLIFRSWSLAIIFAVIGIVSVSAIILAAHRTRYAFGQDRLTISIPLALDVAVPPIPYSEVWKVTDSDNRRLFVHQGYSTDVIEIRYGRNGYVCISPKDKQAALDILKERCPQAAFTTEHRS